jgi:8-oxo-dGTP pyrophosphatase MutT (NUDIX family)
VAAEREFFEESGLKVTFKKNLFEMSPVENQIWHIVSVKNEGFVPENFNHFTADDGGLNFSFYWKNLDGYFCEKEWDKRYLKVIKQVQKLWR